MLKNLLSVSALIVGLNADCYMHNPRGSNNRLNEASANRDNANRLFDSQNNNRGGYNVGDLDTENGFNEDTYIATPTLMYDFEFFFETDAGHQSQYEMLYFEQSYISVTWTNQHGTGNKKLNSHIVLQFICDTFERADTAGDDGFSPDGDVTTVSSGVATATLFQMKQHGLRVELYNGGNTDTPDDADDVGDIQGQYESNNDDFEGRRESEEFYYLCQNRQRNYNLFHADQNLQGETQIYTRQNPGGTRRGLECPEERDYYPWWHPSPFHDIAVITPDVTYCTSDLAPNSQNVMAKYACIKSAGTDASDPTEYLPDADTDEILDYQYNETECLAAGGEWDGFKWNGAEPECVDSYWTKVNYLGNADNTLRGGMQAKYDWQIPTFQTLTDDHYCWSYTYNVEGGEYYTSSDPTGVSDVPVNCVRMMFRIRYNMSTMDYDPYLTDASQDYDDNEGVISPIEQNPDVDVGVYAQGLRLAINTAQTGRTFQDTSHTFLVCERPSASWDDGTLYNVNVRGKRGNIVQTFPAVEYDFEPKHIFIQPGECMHFQWTGSNTHNNGNPGGDGQTGDAGEGRGGSDRSNIVQMYAMDESYPLTYDKFDDDFFDYVTCYHPVFPDISVSADDARLILGSAGFYRNVDYAKYQIETQDDEDGLLDVLLNNVSASFRQGLLCCVNAGAVSGESELEFSFLSTRNNNFTNRAQKMKIIITNYPDEMDTW